MGVALIQAAIKYYNSWKIRNWPRFTGDFPLHFPIRKEITKDDTILEIGANVGGNTHVFAKCASWVYAFEPSKESFKRLLRNTRKWPNVQICSLAVSDYDGSASLFVEKELSGANSLYLLDRINYQTIDEVQVIDINSIDLKFNVLALDCEGAEVPILSSFKRLNEMKTIYCECHKLRNGLSTRNIVGKILQENFSVSVDLDPTGNVWVIAKGKSNAKS
jgi:FkbM family methyltransferase